MAEAFEPPIGIDRQRATPLKEALIDILFSSPCRAETQIFVTDQLIDCKAIVDHRDVDFLSGVSDACPR